LSTFNTAKNILLFLLLLFFVLFTGLERRLLLIFDVYVELLLTFFFYAAISKSLEPVTGQMNSTIAAKLTAVEGTLKENVTKVVKSKVSGLTYEKRSIQTCHLLGYYFPKTSLSAENVSLKLQTEQFKRNVPTSMHQCRTE